MRSTHLPVPSALRTARRGSRGITQAAAIGWQRARRRRQGRAVLLGLLLALLGCADAPPPPPTVQFHDVATTAGIDFRHFNGATGHYYYVETYGSGAGWLDADNDGWLDAYLVNGAPLQSPPPAPLPTSRLFRNGGDGTFADVTLAAHAGSTGYGMGCSAADYDNDGDQDLYIANFGPDVLLQNQGGGSFANATAQAHLGDPGWSSSCGFLDYDRDGDLDLFVTRYVEYSLATDVPCAEGSIRSYCDPSTYTPTTDLLYRNEGDGTFSEVSVAMGITATGRGLGVAFTDYDDDGDTDIYVANDGTANLLYRNDGTVFSEVGLQAGVWYNANGRAQAGMGVDAADVDGDARPDLVVGNFAMETTTMFRNVGQGQFEDVTDRCGLGALTYMPLTFGLRFLDYDNDGDLDLFAANGHVLDNAEVVSPGHTYAQANQLLANQGDGQWVDVSAQLGADFRRPNVGRSAATADYDNDGDMDLLVNQVNGPARLLRNDGGNGQHWLLLHLRGQRQRDALGSLVTVTAAGRRQVRERQSGASYQSSHDPRLHFGLGAATQAQVEIRWPSGQVQDLGTVAADQLLTVSEPP